MGVRKIEDKAFKGYTGLTNVTIPSSVTLIDTWAFVDCYQIQTVRYIGTEEEWKQINMAEGNAPLENATKVYVPDTTVTAVFFRKTGFVP